ncbi:hypothetical protein [Burkholderia glumae]|uniref:hypothetical protein n=1 Tax=Burkholderia glumae TaxID=337 RepID=UPI001C20EE2C|nr:hypothetical protein [Burkholderia glumae]
MARGAQPAGFVARTRPRAEVRACRRSVPGPELDGERGLNVAGWANKLTGAATISMGSVGLSGDMLSTVKGESSAPAGLANLIARIERGAPAPENRIIARNIAD